MDIAPPALLTAADPAPVRILNPDGPGHLLLVCDHAGKAVPAALHGLGVPEAELDRHIGWDIGAARVTEGLVTRLNAQAVLSVYSRLVVDCNRWPDSPTLMPTVSDGTPVPANHDLTEAARALRMEALYQPYHAAIAARCAAIQARGQVPVLVSIHSFTPRMNGFKRPWQVGVLWNRDGRMALPMLEALRAEGDLTVGDNEPYSARTGTDFTIIHHGEDAGLPVLMLEIRQDLIADAAGADAWADRLARLLPSITAPKAV
jgi:predicted N-formylglutamate amidohydrolase